MAPDTGRLVAAILNSGYMVRHYARGGRMTFLMVRERDLAIMQMGVTVRDAFNRSTDFAPLLAAIVDGLRPKDEPPF